MLYFTVLRRGLVETSKIMFAKDSNKVQRIRAFFFFLFSPIISILATISIRRAEERFSKAKRAAIKQKFPNMKGI